MEDLELWDAAAPAYAGRADSFYRRAHGFLWSRLGAVQGLEVLDLGCGDGWLAEEIRPARSRPRPALAPPPVRQDRRPHGLDGHPGRGPSPGRHRGGAPPGGGFVFTILHPAFFSRAIIDEGPGGQRYRKVTGYLDHETRWIESFGGHRHYHRPVSWYIDLVHAQTRVIIAMRTCRATGHLGIQQGSPGSSPLSSTSGTAWASHPIGLLTADFAAAADACHGVTDAVGERSTSSTSGIMGACRGWADSGLCSRTSPNTGQLRGAARLNGHPRLNACGPHLRCTNSESSCTGSECAASTRRPAVLRSMAWCAPG